MVDDDDDDDGGGGGARDAGVDDRWRDDDDDALTWDGDGLCAEDEDEDEDEDEVDSSLAFGAHDKADETTTTGREHAALTTAKPVGEARGATKGVELFGTVFTHAKAGMENVDVERVKRIIYEATAGTPHYENEQRKERRTTKRIELMKKRARDVTQGEWEVWERLSDERAEAAEATRDVSRRWLVCDMDGFYAACEELANPALKTVPMGVAAGPSSVLTTANYVARKFGVRAAMPGFIAKKLCPDLVFVKPDFKKYIAASRASRTVFAQYDPNFIAGSLDEAYIEVTKYCEEHGTTMERVAEEIRAKVKEVTGGLTCSVGGGYSRRLAKVCSDFNKPNGQYILEPTREATLKFLEELPVRKMYGVGKTLERMLVEFGVKTCGDLLKKRAIFLALFTPKAFEFLLGVALGIGTEYRPSESGEETGRKGVSKSETFTPTSDKKYLDAKLTEMATGVALECQSLNLKARMVAIKLKRHTFDVIQRQTTLAGPTNDVQTIVNSALRLMRNENSIGAAMTLRLVGVRASQFDHEDELPEDQAKIENFLLSPTTIAETQKQTRDEPKWTCLECARAFPESQKEEHLDWHYARKLQSIHDAAQSRARLAASHKGAAKRAKGQQSNLSMFLVKKK